MSREYSPPGHKNPAMGFFWAGAADQHLTGDPIKAFFGDVRTKHLHWLETRQIFTGCSDTLAQSIGRGRTSREGSLVIRESRERHDKISSRKKRHIFGYIGPNVFKSLDQRQQFSMENFHFFAAEEPTWGGITLKLASQYPSWGIYTSMPHPLFGAKDFCHTDKKVPGTKKLFSRRQACSDPQNKLFR